MEVTKTKTKTLRTKHSEALVELDKYKLLVESIQDYAIFLLDNDGYIQSWNIGAERNKGYKPNEIIGQHFSVFYMAEDIKAGKPDKELVIAKQYGRVEDEDWRVRKDGSRFWASVLITALFDSSGEHVGFAKVTRDLTERKLHEDELRRANSQLKAQSNELERLNQSKDDFISLASHQLRTPATVVKQMLGLFTDGILNTLDEPSYNIVSKAYISNERLISIINSLLKVAQVDSGKMKLKKTMFNLNNMILDIISDFKDDIADRQQHIEFKSNRKSIPVIADMQNLRMAIENIISNASKYTFDNGTIAIKVHKSAKNITISITDNGVGIPSNEIGKLFVKFARLQNDLSDKVGGTGLGLYWSNKIIEMHKGRIEVESSLNNGSIFKVFLPIGDK